MKCGLSNESLVLYARIESFSTLTTLPPTALTTACAAAVSHSEVSPSLG